jgi:hypothetical protein
MLVRLAGDTGGRLTRNTNDLSLAFARAQRDLGCRYTVGFYLKEDAGDRPRRMVLHVKRPGLRARHPGQHVFRTESEKRSGELKAAFFAPEMFQARYLRTHVFPLHPTTPKTWETLLAVSFPVRFDSADASTEIDFGGVLHSGPKVVHSFNRRVTLNQRAGIPKSERRFTFLEPVELEPGTYELTVVVADAGGEERPGATRIGVEVLAIPKREMMLVQPILGRPRDRNIVVRGDGPTENRKSFDPQLLAAFDIVAGKGSFEPLLVQLAEDVESLYARNKACLVAARDRAADATIERAVVDEDGGAIALPAVPLEMERAGKISCQNVFEVLPEESIDPGRYVLETTVQDSPKRSPVSEALRFAVHGSDGR